MEEKKRFRFLRELPRRRLLMLALIFIVVSIVGVLAGNVVFRQGDLTVDGKLGVGTTNPQKLFHLSHSTTGSETIAAFENTDMTPGNAITLSFRTPTTVDAFDEIGAIVLTIRDRSATKKSDLEFWNTINGAKTNQVIIKGDTGNVGIGTTTPSEALTIDDGVGGSGSRSAIFINTGWSNPTAPGTLASGDRILFYSNADYKTGIGFGLSNDMWFQTHSSSSAPAFRWFTGVGGAPGVPAIAPTEKMTILGDGRVGIGTTTPVAPLDVRGEVSGGVLARFERTIAGSGPLGWAGVIQLAADTDPFVRYGILGSRDASNVDTLIRFWISVNKDSATPWNDGHFVIDSAGRVGIGTTTPQRTLHISNAMRLAPRGTPPGTLIGEAVAASGDLYVDSDPIPDELCFYDGTSWQGISSGIDSNCA